METRKKIIEDFANILIEGIDEASKIRKPNADRKMESTLILHEKMFMKIVRDVAKMYTETD